MGESDVFMPKGREVVVGLNYYSPYVSGLTNSARDIAEGLVERGWRVTVVASQHTPDLPREESIRGVRVVRVPKIAQVGKGAISPRLPATCARLMRHADAALMHLPMAEAGLIASLVGGRTPIVTMYHCDVHLSDSSVSRLVERAVDASSRQCARLSRKVVVTSSDYLTSSRLKASLWAKHVAIPPPAHVRPPGTPSYRDGSGPHVGFLGRLVEEKGIPYLIEAFQQVAEPDWRLLIGGDYEAVAGGSVIRQFARTLGEDPRIHLLGFIPDTRLSDFYASLDVFAFPSVNPLEAFGIVQVEAMFSGVPVVASSLPGVRQPVLQSGFGLLAPPRDAKALGVAISELLAEPHRSWEGHTHEVRQTLGLGRTLDAWEAVLNDAIRDR